MPRNKLPNVEVLEPLDEPIEIVENIGDLVEESKKEHVNPFVEPEKPKKVEAPLNYNNLTAKKLREICKSKGYRNYSKLKKSDLIKMLNGLDVTIPEKKPKKSISINIDTENEEVIPKEKKIEPKSPIKKEELKDNLVKEEPLITDEEIELMLEEKEVEKPKPKRKPALKPQQQQQVLPPQQPVLPPQQPVLPPQQPILPPQQPKKKPFAFKHYYTIY